MFTILAMKFMSIKTWVVWIYNESFFTLFCFKFQIIREFCVVLSKTRVRENSHNLAEICKTIQSFCFTEFVVAQTVFD
jgi:hypothetical protein